METDASGKEFIKIEREFELCESGLVWLLVTAQCEDGNTYIWHELL